MNFFKGLREFARVGIAQFYGHFFNGQLLTLAHFFGIRHLLAHKIMVKRTAIGGFKISFELSFRSAHLARQVANAWKLLENSFV